MHYLSSNPVATSITCPFVSVEQQRIREQHRVLASTGCTRDFCQAGRAVHTDEPRVGENRCLENVQKEATEFIRELFEDGFFPDQQAYETRLQAVLSEILSNSTDGIARGDKIISRLGGPWSQTPEELAFGIKRAWRNSRKCIGRNHYQELKLCDLRSVTSSLAMAEELLRNLLEVFNNGRVEPTVFVFPPRANNSRGPIILNEQVLDFAGYELDNGAILGDPSNVGLTKAMIELGWNPPRERTRWDLLPLVTMAENDGPAMVEVPAPISDLVTISHPQYAEAFDKLDLKWKAAPALTRLGFDIGGCQYTAAPFIGWFVDAEIGVRNLADNFRYNALPDIIQALDLTKGKGSADAECFEELEEYEQLATLSRAQAELNYAVQWSYRQAGIVMLDSLTASKKWCAFDDDFKAKHGYRLPADPYWLALPQGSIIPVWHRGGAPNYQPKPMISRHVQDPVKAWRREGSKVALKSELTQHPLISQEKTLLIMKQPEATFQDVIQLPSEASSTETSSNEASSSVTSLSEAFPSETSSMIDSCPNASGQKIITIYYCSAGTTAEKLAKRLLKRAKSFVDIVPYLSVRDSVEPLDNLKAKEMTADKIFLFIISSTGKGDVPENGSNFLRITASSEMAGMRFSVFGNGDSRYSLTYNGAALKIHKFMQDLGGISILGRIFRGDTAVEPIPFSALSNWWQSLEMKLSGDMDDSSITPAISASGIDVLSTTEASIEVLEDHAKELRHFDEAAVITTNPATVDQSQRSIYVSLDLGSSEYDDMNCIQILPSNCPEKVTRVLQALGLDAALTFPLTKDSDPTYYRYLTEFVDLELPFKELDWLHDTNPTAPMDFAKDLLRRLSALEALELLHKTNMLPSLCASEGRINAILLDMTLLHTRTYSVASSPQYPSVTDPDSDEDSRNKVEVMIKRIPGGRFSDTFLTDASSSATVKYRIVDSMAGPKLRQITQEPVVIVATGAGFGPVRCLLERRIAEARDVVASGGSPKEVIGHLSIFLGLHPSDVPLTKPILDEATAMGFIDMLQIVESNESKIRVHDKLQQDHIAKYLEAKLANEQALVFVCANEAAAKSTRAAFEAILGANTEEITGERYIEEVF